MKKVYLNTLTKEEIIKRLKNGEVAKFDKSNTISRDDGVVVTKGKLTDAYFEEEEDDEEKFEITETGLYKTRDGRQVYVSFVYDETLCNYPVTGIILGSCALTTWTREGISSQGETSGIDIVEKWED